MQNITAAVAFEISLKSTRRNSMIKGTIIVLKALKEHSKTPLPNQKLVRVCDAWANTMQFSEIVKT